MQPFSITKINWLMLFREVIALCFKKYEIGGQNAELLNVKQVVHTVTTVL
jgi:hypothetical protein